MTLSGGLSGYGLIWDTAREKGRITSSASVTVFRLLSVGEGRAQGRSSALLLTKGALHLGGSQNEPPRTYARARNGRAMSRTTAQEYCIALKGRHACSAEWTVSETVVAVRG